MKKLTFITILLTFVLGACGTAPAGTQSAPGSTDGSLPMVTQLIVGIFKLDGTENAVTAEQAAELLPLWQVYSDLLTSDTAAQEEIDGLAAQLEETMSGEQLKAIKDMNLSQQDVMAVMRERAAGMANTQRDTGNTTSEGESFGPAGGGGMPMGGPPDGGGMPGSGMNAGGQTTGTDTASGAGAGQGPAGDGGQTVLMGALIEYLKSIAGS